MMEFLGIDSIGGLLWALSAFVYLPLMLVLALGQFLLPKTRGLTDKEAVPVTVLVSARNEARDIRRCVDSILTLDYPREKLQIVLVDDFSTDDTGIILDGYAALHPGLISVLHSASMPPNGLEAKARGIANGFTAATGEWVLITDADARLHPQWVRHTLGQLKPDTGMAGGPLMVEANSLKSWIERSSWAFVQTFNLGFAGLGMPFVCVGPNMAIKRSIYVNAGGLETSGSGIAEDLALLKMVVAEKKRIQTLFSPETTVSLTPVPSWNHLFSQQRRWLAGGIEFQEDYKFFLVLGFTWGLAAALFLGIGWIFHLKAWLILNAVKLPIDILWFSLQAFRMNARNYVTALPFIYLYQPFVFTWIPLSFLFTRSIKWMGEGYEIKFPPQPPASK
jgi:cellulose synthase/poly-beta-1,6-N-acetylglucosamine synthase-like glycosyltransferase